MKTRTITRDRLCWLAFCNSSKLPQHINEGGRAKTWVGIGWVDEGPVNPDYVTVVEE